MRRWNNNANIAKTTGGGICLPIDIILKSEKKAAEAAQQAEEIYREFLRENLDVVEGTKWMRKRGDDDTLLRMVKAMRRGSLPTRCLGARMRYTVFVHGLLFLGVFPQKEWSTSSRNL